MPDDKLPQRTLKTTFTIAALFSIVFVVRGELALALGLAIGAMLGIASLWSLTMAVPRLFASRHPSAKIGLGALMLAKLPFYAGVLYFAMASPLVSPLATFVGVALVPAVIVLKVVGYRAISEAPAGASGTPARS
jgi:hypothetical protein